jgi:penicillin-binding protein 1A
VIDALIATEDERFNDHAGIDFKSTLRATFTLGSQGGGSTITQQLAKALLDQGSKNRAWRVIEKLKEWIIAVKLERNFTKEEILTLYLNAVPFGNNIYGIRNASRTFFQKEPDRLNVEEAALLVGMLKGNSIYNPVRNPVASRDRRNVVLGQMAVNGKITEQTANQLKKLPINLRYRKLDENTGYAPYFREILKDEISDVLKDVKKPDGGSYDIYEDGLKIYTTINPRMQEYAEEAVALQLPVLQKNVDAQWNIKNGEIWKGKDPEKILRNAMKQSDRWNNLSEDGLSDKEIEASFHVKTKMKVFAWTKDREKDTVMTPYDSIKYHKQMEQTAFMVMDPVTGEVKAWVGGISFKTYKYDHVNLRTKRQVGSTIKPLLYTQAMEERGFTPETECENVAQLFPGNAWVPAQKRCPGGVISMAKALAYSKNCATAYIMKQVGPAQFAEFLSRINIPTKVEPYPSIALGSCDLSLYEMLWGYTIFAGRGFSTKPYMISRIEDRNGNTIKRFDYSVNREEVISEITAYNMARMMQGTVDVGTARGLRSSLGAAEMGGKTGTTNSNADAWYIGYTPQLLAGAWVGFDDRFIHNQGDGARMASPIWKFFFQKVYADKTLGIQKGAKFVVPRNMNQEIGFDFEKAYNDSIPPAAQGEDQGVGNESDYIITTPELGAESQKPVEDDKPVKKDSLAKSPANNGDPKIGEMKDEPKKKKGLFKRIFGKKDRDS